MSKKNNGREYRRYQAALHEKTQKATQARTAESQQEAAKEFLTTLVNRYTELATRHTRLAYAFADRCWRVHELHQVTRQEWERAEAAEAKVEQLQAQLDAVKETNGHTPKARKSISA